MSWYVKKSGTAQSAIKYVSFLFFLRSKFLSPFLNLKGHFDNRTFHFGIIFLLQQNCKNGTELSYTPPLVSPAGLTSILSGFLVTFHV